MGFGRRSTFYIWTCCTQLVHKSGVDVILPYSYRAVRLSSLQDAIVAVCTTLKENGRRARPTAAGHVTLINDFFWAHDFYALFPSCCPFGSPKEPRAICFAVTWRLCRDTNRYKFDNGLDVNYSTSHIASYEIHLCDDVWGEPCRFYCICAAFILNESVRFILLSLSTDVFQSIPYMGETIDVLI